MIVNSILELNFISIVNCKKNIVYDIKTDEVIIKSLPSADEKTKDVKLIGAINNGDFGSIYVYDELKFLDVKDKTVIDIGANIGDSTIYFALKGARLTIGLEPFPKNYEMAKKNILINQLSDRIILSLGGCASDNRYVTIDPQYESSTTSNVQDFENGIKVALTSLNGILENNNFREDEEIVLKMDCEGCEYETILSADQKILQRFKQIQVEYHYGYKNLKAKLEHSGFRVSVTKPKTNPRQLINKPDNPKMYVGWLYADNINKSI
jgi:FkbM family methyltransferase